MKKDKKWYWGVGCFLLVGSPLLGASWSLTTADFQTRQVDLQSMSGEAVVIKGAGGEESVPVGNLLELSHEASAGSAKSAPFVLMLGNGDRLTGSLAGIEGETMVWKNPAVGEMKVALKDVRAMAKGSVTVAAGGQPPTEDTLTLANGDVVKGIVSGFEGGKMMVTQGGDNVPVPMESVGTVVFAATGKPGGVTERGFRVKLTDGSSLSGKGVTVQGAMVTLVLADGTLRKLPVASVVSIEQVNGPVTFLSSLTPTEDVQRPYLGDPWPTRFDQSVTGGALRTPTRVFARGIGVHAYSRLTYAIDPSYKEFRTQYAIDGAGAYANVDVRILLDGKVAYEKKGVTSGEASEVVKLPVGGVKRLTLEVDYGLSNDTQDRFMWLEPALVR